ncbi:MBL fold metallo-hydrolase [Streptomyces sp. NPDC006923]|uniref:MBL fold metallo-hydrolase n=1 Tax=Streptomyces sp. NPDC006923 TaxID=3155355 RepID=UPI0033F34B6D
MSGDLRYDVHVSGMFPVAGGALADGSPSQWSPLAHTLVHGADEALLTDPPITRAQADELIAWVTGHDVTLKYVYLTHGHADHWLTTNYLLRAFPEAQVLTSRAILTRIASETPGGAVPGLWSTLFGDAVPEAPVTVNGTVFPAEGVRLDGRELLAHEVGHSDTDETSVLHIPSLELVVAGDVVYNNVHQYVAEGRNGGLESWHRALDTVESLNPRVLVSGHKDAQRPDLPSDIGETRRYLDAAAEIIDGATDRAGFYAAVKQRYPDRVNPYTIWLSALRLFED